jgi:hypothetical protein
VRCKINFCAFNFFILGLSGAPRPWRLKILIWRSKIEVALYIDRVLFMIANCSLIPKMYKFTEFTKNTKKVPYRYKGQLEFLTFIWEFSIFKASGLLTNQKNKINKYTEIDFTSHYSFLRLRNLKLLIWINWWMNQ